MLVLASKEQIFYTNIYEHLTKQIDKHVGTEIKIEKTKWYVNIYIDACFSGSAVKEGIRWAKKYDLWCYKNEENYKRFEVYCFETLTYLYMNTYTSTNAV